MAALKMHANILLTRLTSARRQLALARDLLLVYPSVMQGKAINDLKYAFLFFPHLHTCQPDKK
jgi:hypothetical protein